MKGFTRVPSQMLKLARRQTTSLAGGKVVATEAHTLEQALRILEARAINAKIAAANAKRKPTLGEELNRASLAARNRDIHLANGDVHAGMLRKINATRKRVPHPFRELPEDQKPTKAREMFASKAWGLRPRADRELAKKFGVAVGVLAAWLDG